MRPPEDWRRARVTRVIALVTALSWLTQTLLGATDTVALAAGFVPARIGNGSDGILAALLTPLTATLVHATFVHLAFNLLMHLFCGRAVEAIIGGRQLLILYGLGAYASAAAQYFAGPMEITPMVGASGAISAILGAYAMLFGRNRVKIANPTLALWINALWLAIAWIGLQMIVGFAFPEAGYRIAVWAHIGGVLAGLLLAKPLLLLHYRNA